MGYKYVVLRRSRINCNTSYFELYAPFENTQRAVTLDVKQKITPVAATQHVTGSASAQSASPPASISRRDISKTRCYYICNETPVNASNLVILSTMANGNMGGDFVYMLVEREFLRLPPSCKAFKIGKTGMLTNRMRQYPKGSQMITSVHVGDADAADAAERALLAVFDAAFERRNDIGREYFAGDPVAMQRLFWSVLDTKGFLTSGHVANDAHDIVPFVPKPQIIDGEEYYEVDYIVDHRITGRKRKSRKFLVHWLGYDHQHDTWEPEENIAHTDALQAYKKNTLTEKTRLKT